MSLLTRERFEALAEAYGGEIARWPLAERDAAAMLMAAEPAYAQGVLAAASGLDAALDVWSSLPASGPLRDRLIASAPTARRRRRALTHWLWRAGLGAGLAAACVAGLMVGVGLSPDPQGADPVATVMGGYDNSAGLGDV